MNLWDNFHSFITPALTILNAWILWLMNGARRDRDEMRNRVDTLEERLKDFQIFASREYVTTSTIRAMEARILDAIQNLVLRIDKVIDKDK